MTATPDPRPALDATCAAGWYECHFDNGNRRTRYWNGTELRLGPGDELCTAIYTDFIGPLVAQAPVATPATEADNSQPLADTLTENVRLREQLAAAERERDKLRPLVDRAYPLKRGSRASGVCSRHHDDPTCQACYPDWRALILEHIEQSNMLVLKERQKHNAVKKQLAAARAEVHRLRKCLDVVQLAMVAVVQYADSLGPCEVRDRLLEIAKTRPATAADRPEQQARLTQLSETPTPTKGT